MKNIYIYLVGFHILPLLTVLAQIDSDPNVLAADATDATDPQYNPSTSDENNGGEYSGEQARIDSPSSNPNSLTTDYTIASTNKIDLTQNSKSSGETNDLLLAAPDSVDCGQQTPFCCNDGLGTYTTGVFRVNCKICTFSYTH